MKERRKIEGERERNRGKREGDRERETLCSLQVSKWLCINIFVFSKHRKRWKCSYIRVWKRIFTYSEILYLIIHSCRIFTFSILLCDRIRSCYSNCYKRRRRDNRSCSYYRTDNRSCGNYRTDNRSCCRNTLKRNKLMCYEIIWLKHKYTSGFPPKVYFLFLIESHIFMFSVFFSILIFINGHVLHVCWIVLSLNSIFVKVLHFFKD